MPATSNDREKVNVLYLLADHGELSGRDLREKLNEGRGWVTRWSGPAFYNLLAKMEDANLIKFREITQVIDGVEVKVRLYSRK